jgi:D-alanyl-D-alanine carboxypeptidase
VLLPRRVATSASVLLIAILLGLAAPLATATAETPTSSGTLAIEGEPLPPGTEGVVRADGNCLNLRPEPNTSSERIECLPEGTRVIALDGVVDADGHRWQRVQWSNTEGWVALQFLRPYTGPAGPGDSCTGSQSIRPGFNGGLHTGGGFSMVQWGGGTVSGMMNRSAAEGCNLRSIWVSHDGRMVGYLASVPDFVNQPFFDLFPGGFVPSGQLMIANCQPHNGNISAVSAATMVPPPNGSAPRLVGSASVPSISARAAVVIDGDSGAVLFEKDAYEPLPPASLTKIVTAILAIEGADPNLWVLSNIDGRNMPGSSLMGLRAGDCFTMSDLLYGLMLPSGNDAALAIGRFMGLSDDDFVHQMNVLATRIGLTNSSFVDAHGLGGNGHRMSAYDIALASRYGMTLPAFRDVVRATTWRAIGSREMTLYNVNTFLGLYDGSDGIKTGFTGEAGRTLSASAVRDGKRLYVVVLNAQDRHQDAAKLLDWAFDSHSWE